ncbi:MAG: hypothetical protein Q9163_000449 [Psora crenata]
MPTSSVVYTPVKPISCVNPKAARLVKLNVMSQVTQIQTQCKVGGSHAYVVSDAAKRIASARIAERRRRIVGQLKNKPATDKKTSGIKSMVSPVSTRPASPVVADAVVPSERKYGFLTLEFRLLEETKWEDEAKYGAWTLSHLFPICDEIWNADSLIPSGPDSDWILVDHPAVRQMRKREPPKVYRCRGSDNYCSGRPSVLDRNSAPAKHTIDGAVHRGRTCECHPSRTDMAAETWGVHPTEWATTPAEADVQPSRPRKVKFADHLHPGYVPVVTYIQQYERWIEDTWPSEDDGFVDYSWEEDDKDGDEQPEPAVVVPAAKPKDDLDLDAMLKAVKFDDDSEDETF